MIVFNAGTYTNTGFSVRAYEGTDAYGTNEGPRGYAYLSICRLLQDITFQRQPEDKLVMQKRMHEIFVV